MKTQLITICLSLFATTSGFAAVNPAYLGVGDDRQALEAAIKANLTTADSSVTCNDVIFVRLSSSVKVVISGMCSIKGQAPQMACLNLASNKSALAGRSFPELTVESELRMHMTDACDLN